jgi:hypothetical protein
VIREGASDPVEGVIAHQHVVVEKQQQLAPRQRRGAVAGIEKALVALAAPEPQPGQLPPQLGGGIRRGVVGHDHLKAGVIGHRHQAAQRI